MLELNKLYNMDCMQGMKEFPDGFFDLAIVDPPYGIGIDGQKKRVCGNPKHNRKEHIRKSWDKAIPPPEYFRELERVSKAQVIWGGNYFVPYLEQGHKGWLVWDKGQHGLTMSDCELAYTSFDTPTRVFVCLPVARGQYHGLYIELKRQRGGRTSDHQSEWLDALSAQGYKAALCYGWEQAAGTIIEYLTGGGTQVQTTGSATTGGSGFTSMKPIVRGAVLRRRTITAQSRSRLQATQSTHTP